MIKANDIKDTILALTKRANELKTVYASYTHSQAEGELFRHLSSIKEQGIQYLARLPEPVKNKNKNIIKRCKEDLNNLL